MYRVTIERLRYQGDQQPEPVAVGYVRLTGRDSTAGRANGHGSFAVGLHGSNGELYQGRLRHAPIDPEDWLELVARALWSLAGYNWVDTSRRRDAAERRKVWRERREAASE